MPLAEELVHAAEEALRRAVQAEARASYADARREEEKAAQDAERALREAADALEKLQAASRRAYERGNQAGLESAAQYRRRLLARAQWLGTVLGGFEPVERTPNAYRVTEGLTSFLRRMLPPYEQPEKAPESVPAVATPLPFDSVMTATSAGEATALGEEDA